MSGTAGAREPEVLMGRSVETETIWREFHDRMLSYIRRRVATPDDAEDILQEVFLRVHANLDGLKDSQNVAAWIYRIASNAVTDHYRGRAIAASALTRLAEGSEGGAVARQHEEKGGEESLPSTELAGCMKPFLRRLPEKYGDAIGLTDLGGLTQKEAARKLGLSVSGVKARVQRARSKLKDLLLECCRVELDHRGGIGDYERRAGTGCDDCDCEDLGGERE